MKFVEKFSGAGRIGIFTEMPTLWRGVTIKTPLCLTYTCAGTVPHLTYDVLQHLNLESNNIGMLLQPLPTVVNFQDSIADTGKSLGSFVGLPYYPYHVSMQDPAVKTRSGYNTKNGVAVRTHGGNKSLTPKEFMTIQSQFRPCSYQALCDSDTPRDCTRKRLNKSIDNTLNFLDQCLELHGTFPRLKETSVFGTIQGGYDVDFRKKSAEETAKRNVDGFIIDGFHVNGPEVKDMEFSKVKPLLSEIIKLLPPKKPRMLNGPFSPSTILEAVECGIDMFDSSYAFVLTEAGEALSLPFLFGTKSDFPSVKNMKYSNELNLNDPSYADKYLPIVKGCTCYTCTNFTCAYVHHLLETSELLGKVLLMLHNMFQLSEFFKCIGVAIENQKFDELKKTLNF